MCEANPSDLFLTAELEAQAGAEGVGGLSIWQRGSGGIGGPASGRRIHYPIWYVEPLAGNAHLLGYGLGSLAALEIALDAGLPWASEPILVAQ